MSFYRLFTECVHQIALCEAIRFDDTKARCIIKKLGKDGYIYVHHYDVPSVVPRPANHK